MVSATSSTPRRVAMIGLGIMGASFARRMQTAGFHVTGYDPDPQRCRATASDGVRVASSCLNALREADVVLCSLPGNHALEATATEVSRLPQCSRNRLVVVELSTLDIGFKLRQHDRLASLGATMLDCPVSGTGTQAAEGQVIVYSSGSEQHVNGIRPVLQSFSSQCFYLGPFGNGMRMKLIANLLVAIHNAATAEALSLASKAGIDLQACCEIISAGGAATSRVLELRGPLMASGAYSPPTMRLDLWQKDMHLIREFAHGLNSATPLFSVTVPLYERAVEQGLGALDTAAVYEIVKALPPQSGH
jgi:putative dehydrogenase